MNQGKIILINGTSSSGKSTLAKGLQESLGEPLLHLQLDDFIGMLPATYDWEMFQRMVRGMNKAILAMASEGNNLIVDHVLVDDDWLKQCVELLHNHYVLFVGLRCPIEELERREKKRDARRQGFARQQFDTVHAGKIYDLEIDTLVSNRDEGVEAVMKSYQHIAEPTAFKRMWASMNSK